MKSQTVPKPSRPNKLLPWLDVLAIIAWGFLMLKYWLTDKLNLLIHPNYFGLAILGGIGLLVIGFAKAAQLLKPSKQKITVVNNEQHITLLPPGWGSCLLLTVAILGFLITPQVFASDKALQRGVSDLLGTTRIKPQAFRASIRPEERSLVDWVRTLNVYPEPDAYTGQKAKIQGFVMHPKDLANDYIFLARFVLTCCAADAYPIGLPVKLSGVTREKYSPDSWLEVEGKMTTENISGKRQLTVAATSLKPIPQPKNPYSY